MEKIKIVDIHKNSIAEEVGIEAGDCLISIDDNEVKDIIDYKLMTSDDCFVMQIEKQNKEIWDVEIERDVDDQIGLEFENVTINEPIQCKNNCIFCFMAQMPKGMRDTLYFKDDDYRLSFLDGNYITLTNVSDDELNRIVSLHLSPINISIHSINPDVRQKLMSNPNAKNILNQLEVLKKGDIEINAQIVLVRDYNDKEDLDNTLNHLLDYGENLTSISVVPVGLTKFRDNLVKLKPFDKESAIETIDIIEKYRAKFKEKYGYATVYPSDEFFILAEREIPEIDYYERLLQYENGVGIVSSLVDDVSNDLKRLSKKHIQNIKGYEAICVSGVLAYEYMKKVFDMINEKIPQIKIEVKKIENEFFGKSITVTGLLTASDLFRELDNKDFDNLIIPSIMQNDGVFLDDYTISDVENKLKCNIILTHSDSFLKDLLDAFC